MADDANQPAPSTQQQPKPADHVGAPGTASDTVLASRVPAARPKKPEVKPPEIKDSFREIIETVVFVIVLVFMLKTFLAEAFVIPTGSMATTLLGYHKDVVCDQCEYEFRVNAASEGENKPGRPREEVITARCPNCDKITPIR